jgi:hypothetical protein
MYRNGRYPVIRQQGILIRSEGHDKMQRFQSLIMFRH